MHNKMLMNLIQFTADQYQKHRGKNIEYKFVA